MPTEMPADLIICTKSPNFVIGNNTTDRIGMKDFFKHTLAAIIGVLVAGGIFIFLGLAILVGIVAGATSDTISEVKDNSIFVLDLSGSVMERYTESPLDQILGDEEGTHGLDDILSSIRKAKENDKIKGIYLNAGDLACPAASMQAIRNALTDFKQSGKFIVAYGSTYTQSTYYIASVADKLAVNPSGSIEWHGLSARTLFLKGLLDKIGVEMQIFRVGTYKSAVEPFIATEMSEANRRQTQAFISSIWEQMLTDVAASRNLKAEDLNRLADGNMDFREAKEYVQTGMADTLMYKDEMESYLKQLTGTDPDDDLESVWLEDMTALSSSAPKSQGKDIIAVYYAVGEIDGDADRNEGIDSEEMIRDLDELRKDEDVKAVVLRINSPGGSAYGSEQIWRAVSLLKAEKPVVVSMGDYAASGGYYIACTASRIVAEPTTLTGSIGIFGMIPNAQRLMQEKLGLRYDGVKTNRFADMGEIDRPFDGEEQAMLQSMVDKGYALFTKRCADGRGIPVEELRKVAEGRVWTGSMAKELRLVDELGGLDEALQAARKLARLKTFKVESYPEKEDFLTSLMSIRADRYIHSKVKDELGDYYEGFSFLKKIEQADKIQARMPFTLTIR